MSKPKGKFSLAEIKRREMVAEKSKRDEKTLTRMGLFVSIGTTPMSNAKGRTHMARVK